MARSVIVGLAFYGAVIAALAGCGDVPSSPGMRAPAPMGTGVTTVPREERRAGRAVNPAVTGPLVYVAGGKHGDIEIFSEKETLQRPVGAISEGVRAPHGL